MPTQVFTAEQIAAVLAGDLAMTRRFIELFSPLLRGYLRKRLQSGKVSHLIEDILQEIWIEVLKNHAVLQKYRPDGGRALTTFLCQFARWRLPAILQRRGLHAPDERSASDDKTFYFLTDGRDEALRQEHRALLRALIEHVNENWTEKDRRLFELFFIEQTDDPEIAREFSATQNTVQQWRHRMRDRLLDLRDEFLRIDQPESARLRN